MKLILIAITFLTFTIGIAPLSCAEKLTKVERVPKTAQKFISEFRLGKDFDNNDSLEGIIRSGSIDSDSLRALGKELAISNTPVRENIVKLLEQVGRSLDVPKAEKFRIIRNHAVIKTLIVDGFSQSDAASSAAEKILLARCLPSDLAAFNDIYVNSLQNMELRYLNLTAKAKTPGVVQFVEELAKRFAQDHRQGLQMNLRIARAALGNVEVERGFIDEVYAAEKMAPPAPPNRFYNVGDTKDGTLIATKILSLGIVGTRQTLQVASSYLRSTLKSYVVQVSERSIRHAALDAIRYNFPDERVLHKPLSVDEWAAAEQFCIQKFGAVFDGPTPNIPPDMPYPGRMNARPAPHK